jgi:hypothetical protein
LLLPERFYNYNQIYRYQQATGVDTKMVYETELCGRRNQAVKEILGEILCSEPEREYYFNIADGTITMNISRTGYPKGVNVSWYTMDPLHYPVFNENDEYLGSVLSYRGFLSMERLAEAVRKAKAKMSRYPW